MSFSTSLTEALGRAQFHACAFVRSTDEERELVDPFFVHGMERGEKAYYIVDPARQGDEDARLKGLAPAPDLAEVVTWHDAHLKGGSFDATRMQETLEDMIRTNAETGRPPMRLVGQMGWVTEELAGIEALVAYEAAINETLHRNRTPTLCVYDVRQLTGATMMDLLRAHPLTIVNGALHENPFYTPPAEFLRDLRTSS